LFNNIVAGRSLRTLLASNTSTIAKKFGIQKLKQETAQNYSVGFTYNHSGFTATVDGYLIDVKDRIILTDVFDVSAMNIGAEAAQFFANGIDTRTTGLDVILNYKMTLPSVNRQSLSLGLAGNFNNTKIAKIKAGSLNEYTFFGPFSRAYLEAAAPDYKISAIVGYSYGKFSVQATWTQFSQIIIQDFQWVDSPATTQDEADALYAKATDVYKAAGTLDLSLNYEISKKLSFTLGANNLLNSYPTPQFDGWTDQGGFSDSVLMGSDGAYVFGKLNFQF
jgi:iron complex outermembrane receptor protein